MSQLFRLWSDVLKRRLPYTWVRELTQYDAWYWHISTNTNPHTKPGMPKAAIMDNPNTAVGIQWYLSRKRNSGYLPKSATFFGLYPCVLSSKIQPMWLYQKPLFMG